MPVAADGGLEGMRFMSSRSRGRRTRPTQHLTPQRVNPIRRGETIDLGDFSGDERPPLTASFRYFGETIRVNPDLSEIDIMDFVEGAEELQPEDPRAMAMIKKFVRSNIHPGDFDEFWGLVRDHRQTAQEVMDLMWKVIGGVSVNPTGQPSGSSDGRPATTASSPRVSSPPASPSEEIDPLAAKFQRQIARFQDPSSPDASPLAGTPNGVAIAAQIAMAAESRGVKLNREPVHSGGVSA